ncbi:MAG: galactose-1-epimerase [Verrucomicrobiales bacterium]|nr:galactose-1-epimerase [Verrucomicrobiales bacterium]
MSELRGQAFGLGGVCDPPLRIFKFQLQVVCSELSDHVVDRYAGFIMPTEPTINLTAFGKTNGGATVTQFALNNGNGLRADVIDYGATIARLFTHDRYGREADVVLGFDNIQQYESQSPYFGCVVGRYGNRIAKGRFKLTGKTYRLAVNNGPNSLHGGMKGFDKAIWEARPSIDRGEPGIEFRHVSPDGDEGYPGKLTIAMRYVLTKQNAIRLEYEATTDKATPVNLTNHSYFNLKGEGEGDILDHQLTMNSKAITAVNQDLIPTGDLMRVKGTPFDFTKSRRVGERIEDDHEQLRLGNGYDHNFVLNNKDARLRKCATVFESTSGREMEVWTTEPAVQLYVGNFLDGMKGKSGRPYRFRNGLCLECQHYPDSPNQPEFPSTILKPRGKYTQVTEYRFAAR